MSSHSRPRPVPRAPRAVAPTAILALVVVTSLAHAWEYPATRVDVVRDTLHGVVVEDSYRWLEDAKSHDTRAWLDREIDFTHQALAKFPGRDRLHARLEQLLKVESRGTPMERGGRLFFTRRAVNEDQPVLCVREGVNGEDRVLVDPNAISGEHMQSAVFEDIALDGSRVAIGTRVGGKDEVEVTFRDVATGRELPDRLPLGDYFAVTMTADLRGVYYTRYDNKRGGQVRYHVMGTDVAHDPVVFGQHLPPEASAEATLSQDGRHLVVFVFHGWTRNEVYVRDLTHPDAPFVPIVSGYDARFLGDMVGDRLTVLTNWKAPNSRIVAIDLAHPDAAHWRTLVHEGTSPITDFTLAGGRMIVSVLDRVKSRLEVYTAEGRPDGEIAFPSLGSVSGVSGRWDSAQAFYTFTSFHIPRTIYRYEIATRQPSVWWRAQVPVASDELELKQVWFTSRDGTRVPMFVLARKGTRLDGHNPTLLTGYGGFGISETPEFSPTAVVWAERGGVYAMANLRGGNEFGEPWHRAGMLAHKQNVFDDFIGAAEYLVHEGYTRPERLGIAGGSNGGLLVGAAMTQRPDLFGAVLCKYPLLDMLRYQKFMVARLWVPEYGSAEDPAQFQYLRAYSPYQHVQKGVKYPATMIVSGDSDTRVDPLHARKMAALLQASTASNRPVLLHYDTLSGHSGGKPILKAIDDATDDLLFLTGELGVPEPPPANAHPTP